MAQNSSKSPKASRQSAQTVDLHSVRQQAADASGIRDGAAGKGQSAGPAGERRPAPAPRSGAQHHPARPESDPTAGQARPGPGRQVGAPRPSGAARARIAANDDMPTIGGLIYALNQRPSRSPFVVAMIASVVWFILGIFAIVSIAGDKGTEISGIGDFFSGSILIATMAGIVVPIALFWFLAYLIWRAQELRIMSTAMTEVAVRLAEPDKMAEQSVASLGQTVRRQVAAMNDAISRALGRAGELEALVHNEVAALERSYSENEHRIRNLVNELASEREALANNSHRVSEALRGIGGDVTREINAASEQASKSLVQATSSLAETLANRGEKITAAVSAAGTAIDQKLAERGTAITEQLSKHGARTADMLHQSSLQVSAAIQQASDRAAAAVSAKSNSLVHSVISMSERVGKEIPALLERLGTEQSRLSGIVADASDNLGALETALSERTKALETTLGERGKMLQTVLAEHSRAIDASLTARTKALETLLGQRAQEMNASLGTGAERLSQSILERTKTLEAALSRQSGTIHQTLEKHATAMEKSLSRQTAAIEHSVGASSRAIQRAVEELAERSGDSSQALETQAQSLRDVSRGLLEQVHGLSRRFEEQGSAITNAAKSLETSNARVDALMESRQVQLNKLLSSIKGRADELDRMMQGYAGMLEDSLAKAEVRARQVTEVLAHDSAEKSQAAVREIEQLRSKTQEQTDLAITELRSRFSELSGQVNQQLAHLSSRFSKTSQDLKSSTQKVTSELRSTQAELQHHVKTLPETTRESASAMRKALQDQLSALDQLSGLANRHSQSASVARPQRAETGSSSQARRSGAPRPALGEDEASFSKSKEPGWTHASDPANAPTRGGSYDFEKPRYDDLPRTSGRAGADERLGKTATAPSSESLEAVTAGLVKQLEARQESGAKSAQHERASTAAMDDDNSADDWADTFGSSGGEAGMSGGGQWSLGDLLARASEPDDDFLSPAQLDAADQPSHSHTDPSLSHGQPPFAPPVETRGANAPSAAHGAMTPATQFNMKDIADAVDHETAVEVWKRYNRGERSSITRDVYSQQGQITFDQVERRYQHDATFRHIVDRYMLDFEKVLRDASRSGKDGRAVQGYLTSETGRIYLMLAHASGRLG